MKSKINYTLRENIANYFGLSLPIWIQSRKSLLIFYFLDLAIFIFFYLSNSTKINSIDNLKVFTLSLSWGLLSYIFGRYSKESKYPNAFIEIYYLLLKTIFVLILVYIFDKIILIFLPYLFPIGRNSFLFIGLSSAIIQSLRLIIINSLNKKNKSIFIIGKEDDIRIFKKQSKNFLTNKNTKIIKLNCINDLFSSKEKDFKTVVIATEGMKFDNTEFLINETFKNNVEILNKSEWFEKYVHKIPSQFITLNFINYSNKYLNSNKIHIRIKRMADVFLSLILLFLTFPIIFIVAILIKLEDNGPVFYNQVRTGLFEQPIIIRKLRSMKIDSENNGAVWANKNDKRITKVGRLIRKARIDELPQLINVLIGDMSLIGPRPERPQLEEELNEKIPNYKLRHIIKPGLSGWAQVNFPYGSSISDSSEKLSYDLFYIQNKSIWLDLLIFIQTIKLIFKMKGY
ncbi:MULTISPECIES: exopolysaccharide biosynthesis polyprenyl glycosylphosphotransferase [Prochlorococcus]|uniref:Sugar transferase involved in lipopolysaccharide synthesi n=1 Tax=Prochlorococcus marinus str. MIT 9314 TaxID=167548 RepID=A0A0A2AIT6_PROMR|nr:exopolysaccharide biosynthesis polyprenyl glycosylphosphotransferase [Prochlorococcus marinus]KGG00349.1 Sugar transferase involved in lipopolysaccharide synthesi [Prochlorococcus marinus str. MIT 9314]